MRERIADYSVRTKSGDYLTTKGTWAQLNSKTAYFETIEQAREAMKGKKKGYIVANADTFYGDNCINKYEHIERAV